MWYWHDLKSNLAYLHPKILRDVAETATNSASDAIKIVTELIWESFHEKIFGDDDEAEIVCASMLVRG